MFCLKLFMVVLLLAFSMIKADILKCANLSPDVHFSYSDNVAIIKVTGEKKNIIDLNYFVNEVEILKANKLRKGYETIINQLNYNLFFNAGTLNFKINETYIVSIEEFINNQGGPDQWDLNLCSVILRANDVSKAKWDEFVDYFRKESKKNVVFNSGFNQGYELGSNNAYNNGYQQGYTNGYYAAYESIKRTYNFVNLNDYNRYNNWYNNGYYYGIKAYGASISNTN